MCASVSCISSIDDWRDLFVVQWSVWLCMVSVSSCMHRTLCRQAGEIVILASNMSAATHTIMYTDEPVWSIIIGFESWLVAKCCRMFGLVISVCWVWGTTVLLPACFMSVSPSSVGMVYKTRRLNLIVGQIVSPGVVDSCQDGVLSQRNCCMHQEQQKAEACVRFELVQINLHSVVFTYAFNLQLYLDSRLRMWPNPHWKSRQSCLGTKSLKLAMQQYKTSKKFQPRALEVVDQTTGFVL